MLRFMRRHKRSAVVKGLLVIIILVFVGWGVGSYEQARQTASVAIVNGIPITVAELNRAHQNLLQTYQELYGAAYSPELVRQLDLQGRVLEDVPLVVDLVDKLGVADRLRLLRSVEEVGKRQHRDQQAEPYQECLCLLFHGRHAPVRGTCACTTRSEAA